MSETPETILKDYAQVLSDTLLVVSEKGPKQHKRLELNLAGLAGLSHEQRINSFYYSKLVETFSEIKDPCVYWFEVLENYDLEKIWSDFHTFKQNGTHKLPRTKKRPPRNTNILYLGKVKFNLLRRMKEHLGFTEATKTQSLQLCHWASDLGLTIEINVLEFEQETSNLVGAFEFKLAREMKTILGSHRT